MMATNGDQSPPDANAPTLGRRELLFISGMAAAGGLLFGGHEVVENLQQRARAQVLAQGERPGLTVKGELPPGFDFGNQAAVREYVKALIGEGHRPLEIDNLADLTERRGTELVDQATLWDHALPDAETLRNRFAVMVGRVDAGSLRILENRVELDVVADHIQNPGELEVTPRPGTAGVVTLRLPDQGLALVDKAPHVRAVASSVLDWTRLLVGKAGLPNETRVWTADPYTGDVLDHLGAMLVQSNGRTMLPDSAVAGPLPIAVAKRLFGPIEVLPENRGGGGRVWTINVVKALGLREGVVPTVEPTPGLVL